MFNKFTLYAISLAFLSITFLSSCDDDEPAAENETEQITKATLTFSDGTNTVVGTYLDVDGDGPANGTFSPATIQLNASTAYTLTIALANTLETPEEDVTVEVKNEGDEHQLFYSYTNGIFTDAANTWYDDKDVNDLPIGIATNWNTGATAGTTGTFTVTLKHQPGVKTATSTINDGESEFLQSFTIELQ